MEEKVLHTLEEIRSMLKAHIAQEEPLLNKKEIIGKLGVSYKTFRSFESHLPYYRVGKVKKYKYTEALQTLKNKRLWTPKNLLV
jgi:hypothetical protein